MAEDQHISHSEAAVPQPAATVPKKQKRFWKYVRRTLLVFLLLIMMLIASTQSGMFRDFLRTKISSLVADATNAELTIGDIGGNFITGTSLSNVSLRLKNDTTVIARIPRVSVQYSLWSLIFSKDIAITAVTLDSPSVTIVKRSGDSLWNIAKLFKPSVSTEPSTPFTQTILLDRLDISEGYFRVIDENDTAASAAELPYDNPLHKKYVRMGRLDIEHFMLRMGGSTHGADRQYAAIEHLSFQETNAPFNIYHLSLTAYRDHASVTVKDLKLLTDGSDVSLNAALDPLVMLDGKPYDSLYNANTKVSLRSSTVSQLELAQFIPNISFLSGSPTIDLEADGPYGVLKIRRGKLDLGKEGSLAFSGTVKNLNQPWKLFFDVDLTGKQLSNRTVQTYLPGLGLPDLSNYGTLDIQRLSYIGTPLTFSSDFDLRTTNGNLNGKGKLDLTKKLPAYEAIVESQNLDLAPILNDSSFRSLLNLRITAKGSGFNVKTMATTVKAESIAPSHFYTLDINTLSFSADLNNGVAGIDNTHIAFADGSSVSSDYARYDLADPTHPYECDVTTSDVKIHKFISAFPPSSTATANATLAGRLSSMATIVGSIHTVVNGLPYRGDTLPPIHLNATLQMDDSSHGRSDVISSDIADISVKGKYDVETLGYALNDRLNALAHSFDKLSLDSDAVITIDTSIHHSSECTDTLRCTISTDLKDLRPLEYFIHPVFLLAKGKLNGTIQGCPNDTMSVRVEGKLNHLFISSNTAFGDSTVIPTVIGKELDLRIGLRRLTDDPNTVLSQARGWVRVSSDSSLYVSGVNISQPSAAIRLDRDSIRYSFSGSVEDKTDFKLKGNASVRGSTKSFALDSVLLTFSDGFQWFNEGLTHVKISNTGLIRLDTLTLIKPEPSFDPGNRFAQRLSLGLEMLGDSIHYAYLHTSMLRVADLPKFFSAWTDVSALSNMTGRLPRFNIDAKGTFAHPQATADLLIKNITYNTVTIDSGSAQLSYKDATLRGKALLHVDSEAYSIENLAHGREQVIPIKANAFTVDIDSVPFLFSLAKYPGWQRDSALVYKRPLDVRLQTKDFPVDMFSSFVPVISNLHGLSDIGLFLHGTRDSIIYGGQAIISKGSFGIPYTNLGYQFSGPIKLANSELRFDNVTITNFPNDDPEGRGQVNGSFHFKGFGVDHFDLSLRTPHLLVLSDASKQTMKTIYGPLVIQSGNEPLRFHGTFDEPHLDGILTIPQAYLTLPQTVTSAVQVQNDGITYVVISQKVEQPLDSLSSPDTTAAPNTYDPEQEAFESESYDVKTPAIPQTGDEESETTAEEATPSNEIPFMDRMLYYLKITIPGDFWLNINFNRAYGLTGEQLKAELQTLDTLKFSRFTAGASYNFNGTLSLTDRSSYKFIREFSPVTGKISFDRELDNPSLDLVAEYTGTHLLPDDKEEELRVRLLIKGDRYNPQLTFELYRKSSTLQFEKDIRPQDQIQNDVLYYLATGSLPTDASTNAGGNFSRAASSSLVSSVANNLIGSTSLKDYIRSVGFEYGETGTRFKANLNYKSLSLRYSGQYNNNASTTNLVSIRTPLSSIIKTDWAKSFLLEGEYYNDNNASGLLIRQSPVTGKILFQIE